MKMTRMFLLFALFLLVTSSLVSAYPMMRDYRYSNTFQDSYQYRQMHNTADDYYFHHRSMYGYGPLSSTRYVFYERFGAEYPDYSYVRQTRPIYFNSPVYYYR